MNVLGVQDTPNKLIRHLSIAFVFIAEDPRRVIRSQLDCRRVASVEVVGSELINAIFRGLAPSVGCLMQVLSVELPGISL